MVNFSKYLIGVMKRVGNTVISVLGTRLSHSRYVRIARKTRLREGKRKSRARKNLDLSVTGDGNIASIKGGEDTLAGKNSFIRISESNVHLSRTDYPTHLYHVKL